MAFLPKISPLVVMENAAGWQQDFCCNTFGSYNYGRFIELAGGVNYGSTLANAYSAEITLESIIAADPDVMLSTGANWAEARPEVTATSLGYDDSEAVNQERLQTLAARPGFSTLRAVAVEEGRFHSIYHQFYNSPFHFVAIQQVAQWLYPEEFSDLDVEDTMLRNHDRFLPDDYEGQLWVSLSN